MKNKVIISGFLLISLLSVRWTYTIETMHPNEQIQARLKEECSLFKQEIENYINIVENGNKDLFLKQYKKTRAAYKKIETYIVFRYPTIDKAINGGPVPSITKDVVILHKDDPTGLQVIEELIVENNTDQTELLKQLEFMTRKADLIATAISSRPFQNWEVLEANHMAITKLITLSLSGFDSPVYLLSIEDAIVVLKQLKRDLTLFKPFVGKEFNYAIFQDQLDKSITYLKKNNDFDSMDRYRYYRDCLLPLQTNIKKMHLNTGYESYREVSNIKRSISTGEHLFSEDYLDPYYSVRGNVISYNNDQINLGKVLFFDPILSANNKRACASCHSPNKAFSDGIPKSLATNLKGTVQRNSPTLINSCFQDNFFWDLRSNDMNDQILGVILSEAEFNTTPDEIVGKLKQSDDYQQLFKKAFYGHQEPISIATVKSSLELYIRSLVNLNSKFDQNIRGGRNSLSEKEIEGANLFMGKAACSTCHFPPNFNGFVPPHYNDTEGEILGTTKTTEFKELDDDNGMYDRFSNNYPEATYIKGMFKTPTIRNAELTAPYMHNGMFETLEDVVTFYNNGGGAGMRMNIPQQTLAADSLGLSNEEQQALIAFIKTLSDTIGTNVEPFDLPKFSDEKLDNRRWGGEY